MLTLALYGLLAILLAGLLFVAAAFLLPAGEQIAPPIRDEPIWDLPAEKRLDSTDVETVRLPVALRGYRFAETDLLLDRLAEELRARDEEIVRLRAGGSDSASGDEPEWLASWTDTESSDLGSSELDSPDEGADAGRDVRRPVRLDDDNYDFDLDEAGNNGANRGEDVRPSGGAATGSGTTQDASSEDATAENVSLEPRER